MKKIVFILFLLISNLLIGQNLVINPSFETFSQCPTFYSQIQYATGWLKAGLGTPDYFNSCAPSSPLRVSVPDNSFGYQFAATGVAYCGIYNWDISTYREVTISNLITPLTIGTKYYVSFKANLSSTNRRASNKIGVRFTNFDYSLSNQLILDNISHVYSSAIISNTTGWETISGTFVADSNYQYIMIGNFFDNLSTDTASTGGATSYYFVDDVCVSSDSLECYNLITDIKNVNKNNNLTIYPNPTSTHFTIEGINHPYNLTIYNAVGQLLYQEQINEQNKQVDVNNYAKGILFIRIEVGDEVIYRKVIKQ